MTNANVEKKKKEKTPKKHKSYLKLTITKKCNKHRGIKEIFYKNYTDIWEGHNHVL